MYVWKANDRIRKIEENRKEEEEWNRRRVGHGKAIAIEKEWR